MKAEPITGRALAAFLGVHERTIRDLADRGIIAKVARGKYDLAASVKSYCSHVREVAAGRGGESGVASLTSERARLAREQADAAALKNAAMRGDMISAGDVATRWRDILTGVRLRMLAIPGRVGLAAPHFSRADIEVLDREVRDALEEASNG